jgi:hypothetical protein
MLPRMSQHLRECYSRSAVVTRQHMRGMPNRCKGMKLTCKFTGNVEPCRLRSGYHGAGGLGTMPTKRKHSSAEIAAMLAQANEMAAQGKLQSEIAETLGISVMTLHRWRKATPAPHLQIGQFEEEVGQSLRISELQLENSRLRA